MKATTPTAREIAQELKALRERVKEDQDSAFAAFVSGEIDGAAWMERDAKADGARQVIALMLGYIGATD